MILGIEIHPKGSVTSSTSVIAINCGGGAYIDDTGKLWVSDTGYFNTGNSGTTSAQISGTTKQEIYRSERYDLGSAPEMVYSIPLTNGAYDVVLHLAETYSGIQGTGQRVFDLKIEGTTVFDGVDIYAEAGGRNKALTKTANNILVTGDSLDIEFIHQSENPAISGKFWANRTSQRRQKNSP